MPNFNRLQWDIITDLFASALDLEAPARKVLLESGTDDPEVREEVARLLAHHVPSTGFLDRPLMNGDALRSLSLESTSFPNGEFVNDRFRILRFIGRGGMGEVYEAADEAIGGVRIALKTIRSGMDVDERLQRQFRKEVEFARRVTHPNVCRTYDLFECHREDPLLGREETTLFLTMELLDGESLAEAIARQGPFSSASTLAIAKGIAGALHAAHQQQVIHRDLKSSNVMLVHTRSGTVRAVLTDFGLAHPDSVSFSDEETMGGTPDYMAPEQIGGGAADVRTDIFSLGVVIYEMLAGKRPFRSVSTVTEARLGRPRVATPIRTHAPSLDPAWERIIERCMDSDRDSRYSDCGQMLEALDQIGRPRHARRVVLAAVAFAAFPGSWLIWKKARKTPLAPRSLAILPFQNLGGDKEIDFFAEGLADELTRMLSRQPGLNLIAASSAKHAKGTDLKTAARQLNVPTILIGGIRRNGSRVQLNAQLADAASGTFLWSGSYEEDMDRLGRLPVSLSLAVAGALQPEVQAAQFAGTGGATANNEAFRLYMLGRTHASYRTEDGLKQSASYLLQSIGLDPEFAPAHAALADTLNILAGHADCPRDEYFTNAEREAFKALSIDPRSGEAHLALASVYQRYRWDWDNAEIHFRRALELSPGLAVAHHWSAGFFSNRGRAEAALSEIRIAERLDPLSPSIRTAFGVYLYRARRVDESIAKLTDTLASFPDYSVALPQLGESYALKRMWIEALSAYQRSIAAGHSNDYVRGGFGDTLARAGRVEEAKSIAAKLEQEFGMKQASAAPLAIVYRGLGDKDRVFYWLDVAVREREPAVTILNVDPANDPLRADPRFSKLVARLRL
jgi:serine/threonine-protein kinase